MSSIAITITLPCSDDDWAKLVQMRAMFSNQAIVQAELTPNEEKVLSVLCEIEEDESTPTLDFLEKAGAGKFSASAYMLMRNYMDEHLTTTCKQAVEAIVREYPNTSVCSLKQSFCTYHRDTGKGVVDKVNYTSGTLRETVINYMRNNPSSRSGTINGTSAVDRVVKGIKGLYPQANEGSIKFYFYQYR